METRESGVRISGNGNSPLTTGVSGSEVGKSMKILKQPVNFKQWWDGEQALCSQCGCEVELESSDQGMTPSAKGTHFYISCPICKATMLISKKNDKAI